jgi:hypothetical protein
MSDRSFSAQKAVRSAVPLLIGLFGPSGSGKTMSALRIASGIQKISGGKILAIDTEARRMLHYADQFAFEYVQFDAPFGSLDYLAALKHCIGAGAKIVIVDSLSHEHDGPGGLIDFQELELDRLAGSDYAKRERVKMLAWQRPKAARRALISGLLQLNANFIFCFRAREKTKPIKKDGKTEIIEMGFMPIAGEEFLFEMTVNCMLPPKSGGVPVWLSEHIGELGVMKLPNYLAHAFPPGKVLDEQTGRALAEWASGAPAQTAGHPAEAAPVSLTPAPQTPAGAGAATPTVERLTAHDRALAAAADKGMASLKQAWETIFPADQDVLRTALERRHKPAARAADKAKAPA